MNTKLKNAILKRNNLFNNSETNSFRLFNNIGDGLEGLTIDLYKNYLLVQIFDNKLMDNIDKIKNEILNLEDKIPVEIDGILLKSRLKIKNNADRENLHKSIVLKGNLPPEKYIVKQLGINVSVDLVNSLNTGLFLDMRLVREKLEKYLPEIDSMLNLFCYTGLFSVHALKKGVKQVVNVDLSKPALKRARENYRLNNLEVDDRDFIAGTAGEWLKKFVKKDKNFSLIVFDPPTFSRNKKNSFSIVRDYTNYLEQINKISKNGYVLSAINTYSVTKKDYFNYHPKKWENVFYCNEPEDFPYDKNPYLKVGLWKTR